MHRLMKITVSASLLGLLVLGAHMGAQPAGNIQLAVDAAFA